MLFDIVRHIHVFSIVDVTLWIYRSVKSSSTTKLFDQVFVAQLVAAGITPSSAHRRGSTRAERRTSSRRLWMGTSCQWPASDLPGLVLGRCDVARGVVCGESDSRILDRKGKPILSSCERFTLLFGFLQTDTD